jgi:membrane protease YdiL (CAAX protease family)
LRGIILYSSASKNPLEKQTRRLEGTQPDRKQETSGDMTEPERFSPPNRLESLLLALAITVAFVGAPQWVYMVTAYRLESIYQEITGRSPEAAVFPLYYDSLSLAFGLLLVLGAPRKFGLCLGDIGPNWRRVLAVIAIPLTVCTIGCQFVPLPSWVGSNVGIWLVSPLAQDLVFAGFLYTTIEAAFPGNVHSRMPIRKTLLITGVFFSLHHVQNFLNTDAALVWLQLGYTYLGFVFAGLTRQWTGSLLYLTLSHSAGNFIAWYFAPRMPVLSI